MVNPKINFLGEKKKAFPDEIAEGFDRICKEATGEKGLVSIHGKGHSKGIENYLKYPLMRLKKFLYLPYRLTGKTKIREYHPKKDGWNLIRTF